MARSEKDEPYKVLPVLREHRGRQGQRIPAEVHVPLRPEIEDLEARHAANPGAREAHRALARAVTALVHGDAPAAALKASEILFGGSLDGVTEEIFRDVVGEIPTKIEQRNSPPRGAALTDLLVHRGPVPVKGPARARTSRAAAST